jgi:hypothetical protein
VISNSILISPVFIGVAASVAAKDPDGLVAGERAARPVRGERHGR